MTYKATSSAKQDADWLYRNPNLQQRMSMNDAFIKSVVNHPEYNKIRSELCDEYDAAHTSKFIKLASGARMLVGGGEPSREAKRKQQQFSELCWWVNSGQAYCETSAPEHIRVLLRRLGVKV